MFGRQYRLFQLVAKWIVVTPFLGRHISCVLWLLAGDVRRTTHSFIALALDVHVLPEAEDAILPVTRMNALRIYKLIWEESRCPCCHASAGSSSFEEAGVNGFESSAALCARRCKNSARVAWILLLHDMWVPVALKQRIITNQSHASCACSLFVHKCAEWHWASVATMHICGLSLWASRGKSDLTMTKNECQRRAANNIFR